MTTPTLQKIIDAPVATVLMPDPDDERDGVRFNLKDWKALEVLPAGTTIFTISQLQQAYQAGRKDAFVEAADSLVTQPKYIAPSLREMYADILRRMAEIEATK